jgi:hypothetical protein
MTAQKPGKPRKPQRPRREPRGKTFKQQTPHPSRVGELIANAADDHWSQKIAAIFCPLDSRRDVVEPSESVREALARMADIVDDREAVAAIDGCGEETFGRLVAARYRREAIGEGVAQALRADARRAIDDLDDDWLARTVEIFRYRIQMRDDIESSANIRATLRRMAEIADDREAATAIDHCDEMTRGLLTAARYRRRAPADEGTAAGLRADAARVLADWTPDAGGRPEGLGIDLASAALAEWIRRTGDANPGVFWHDDMDPPCTPVVELAGSLFDAVYLRHYHRPTIAELLREILKEGKKG